MDTDRYEDAISSMKLQQNALLDELKRLREVYEKAKADSADQTRQIKTLEDFYAAQNEISTNEQIDYLLKILHLFQRLRGAANENSDGENDSSIDVLKNQLNQQFAYFATLDHSSLSNHHQHEEKPVPSTHQVPHLATLLSHFEQKFVHLFNSNPANEFDETIEQETDEEIEAIVNEDGSSKKFVTFLNDVYERMKSVFKEKSELDEKFVLLEEKRLTYARWETQMYDILKWINEEKSARSHLKGLANKMAEELDQIRETTSPLLTVGSTSSSMTTAGTSTGHNTVRRLARSRDRFLFYNIISMLLSGMETWPIG